MATGTLLINPRLQALDANGNALSGALLYTYAAGTSTPLATYSDVSLTTANANPVVADSGGFFGPVYQSAASYKIVLKTAAGVTVWSQDNVAAIALSAISSTLNDLCNGRLTLTSVTPVTTADVTAATTVYFTPYAGNRVTLYDGAAWAIYSFSELSLTLGSDAANTNYDVFAYVSGGAVALERLAWTNATTRATGLVLQDGVLVKSGDATRRYLGTYRTTGTIGQTEDSAAKRFLWNYYHRVNRPLRVMEGTNTWTYTTFTWRQANASTANQVAVVVGWAEVEANIEVSAYCSNSNATAVNTAVAVGEDSVTTPATNNIGRLGNTIASAGAAVNARAVLRTMPSVGYHYYAWLEISEGSGTTTWQGDNGGTVVQSGIVGVIQG